MSKNKKAIYIIVTPTTPNLHLEEQVFYWANDMDEDKKQALMHEVQANGLGDECQIYIFAGGKFSGWSI